MARERGHVAIATPIPNQTPVSVTSRHQDLKTSSVQETVLKSGCTVALLLCAWRMAMESRFVLETYSEGGMRLGASQGDIDLNEDDARCQHLVQQHTNP